MPSTRSIDNRGKTAGYSAEKSDSDIADAQARARMSTTAGSGLGARGKSNAGAPKQEPGESTSSFAARYRKYREGMTASDQADALEKRRK